MARGQKRGHGGTRRPAKPAAVSGPGAYSARTDGGPANPILEAPSTAYGERTQREALAAAAPMAGSGGAPLAGAPAGSPPPPPGDIFAPTARPGEPITAGVPVGPGPSGMGLLPDDPDETLRVMWSMHNDPDIAELLADRAMR